jgi:hypothetical protein
MDPMFINIIFYAAVLYFLVFEAREIVQAMFSTLGASVLSSGSLGFIAAFILCTMHYITSYQMLIILGLSMVAFIFGGWILFRKNRQPE